MEQKIDLRKLEKNTATAIFQTGIVDIGIGLVFTVLSLYMIFDAIRYYFIILFIIPIVFMILAIRYIINPRMGVVKFANGRVRKSRILMITITLILVILVTLTFLINSKTITELIDPKWIISGIIFFIFIAIAYFMDFDRMYIYAFLLAGSFYLSEEIRENSWIISKGGYAYLFASIVLIAIGCIYLMRFLKKYPLPEKGSSHDI